VHLLFHVVAMAYSRESCLALGRRPSTLVFVGLIVYLSRTMDVNHCGPPGTDRPATHESVRMRCSSTQDKGWVRAPSSTDRMYSRYQTGSSKQEMLQHCSGRIFFSFVLVLFTAGIYPRLLCAGRCKNGIE
jgi:hypothetical protein